jgi:hypothetical protein
MVDGKLPDRWAYPDDSIKTLLDQIRDMRQRLRWGRVLTTEQRRLLFTALDEYLRTNDEGGGASLDRSLGLRSWGGASAARQDALSRRDEQVRQLWRCHEDWRDLPPPAASRLMAVDAARYQSDRWPRERNRETAPTVEPGATWWKILMSGAAIPRSAKQIQRILAAVDIQVGV